MVVQLNIKHLFMLLRFIQLGDKLLIIGVGQAISTGNTKHLLILPPEGHHLDFVQGEARETTGLETAFLQVILCQVTEKEAAPGFTDSVHMSYCGKTRASSNKSAFLRLLPNHPLRKLNMMPVPIPQNQRTLPQVLHPSSDQRNYQQ